MIRERGKDVSMPLEMIGWLRPDLALRLLALYPTLPAEAQISAGCRALNTGTSALSCSASCPSVGNAT